MILTFFDFLCSHNHYEPKICHSIRAICTGGLSIHFHDEEKLNQRHHHEYQNAHQDIFCLIAEHSICQPSPIPQGLSHPGISLKMVSKE